MTAAHYTARAIEGKLELVIVHRTDWTRATLYDNAGAIIRVFVLGGIRGEV